MSTAPEDRPGENPKTILLVEDEAIIAMTERRDLTRYGYEVVVANTGEKAVDAVGGDVDIDMVLMDINLGEGIDGTEAARRILQTHSIPIVFLSSHTDPDIVRKTELITSYGYIVKNSGITVLDASIKMAFKLFAANELLYKNSHRLELAMQAANMAWWEMDTLDGKVAFDPRKAEMLGYPSEHFTHYKDFTSLIHPDDYGATMEAMKRHIYGSAGAYETEYRILTKDSGYIWFEDIGRLVRGDNAKNPSMGKIVGITVNITERKALEEKLNNAETKAPPPKLGSD
jgi:PAS domain S-box-containing protein